MTYRVVEQVWNEDKNTKGFAIGWVCKHCRSKTTTVYVATGHDHTDFHFDMCTCGEGTKFQDEFNKESRWGHPTHPIEYYKQYFA